METFATAMAGALPGQAPTEPELLYERLAGCPTRPGIVTTVRGMGSNLPSWVHYHLAVGFCKLYIYLDDPEEADALEALATDERVVLTKCDDAHRATWQDLKMWPKFAKFVDEEVQARQELNAEHAVGKALRDAVTWLLHIDADELFHCPACTVSEHFASLSQDGVTVMNYINYEGVPEQDEFENFLENVTLFKRHLSHLPGYTKDKPVTDAVNFWVRRSATKQQYFVGYQNGKSAVAVVEGAVPLSVHEWLPPTPGLFKRGCLNIRDLDTGGALTYREDKACVLHYISCGFEWWWRKYSLLGRFEDAWFGGALPIPACFHTQSRDLVNSGAKEKARGFYRNTMVLTDGPEKDKQIALGVLQRIDLPRELMLQARTGVVEGSQKCNQSAVLEACGSSDCTQSSAPVDLLRCSRCKSVNYCSEQCQRSDWPRHRVKCVPSS